MSVGECGGFSRTPNFPQNFPQQNVSLPGLCMIVYSPWRTLTFLRPPWIRYIFHVQKSSHGASRPYQRASAARRFYDYGSSVSLRKTRFLPPPLSRVPTCCAESPTASLASSFPLPGSQIHSLGLPLHHACLLTSTGCSSSSSPLPPPPHRGRKK